MHDGEIPDKAKRERLFRTWRHVNNVCFYGSLGIIIAHMAIVRTHELVERTQFNNALDVGLNIIYLLVLLSFGIERLSAEHTTGTLALTDSERTGAWALLLGSICQLALGLLFALHVSIHPDVVYGAGALTICGLILLYIHPAQRVM